MKDAKELQIAWGKVVSAAWENSAYAEKLRTTPKEVMKEAGIPYDDSKNYVIMEKPDNVLYIVQPEGTPENMMNVIPQGTRVPDGCVIRFLVNTADTVYIVLPPLDAQPLSDEALSQVAGGRWFFTKTNIFVFSQGFVFTNGFIVTDAAVAAQVAAAAEAVAAAAVFAL